MDDFYDKLLIELECPVCSNYMAPPIRQCETGHSICEACRGKLPKCPLCQKKFTDSKNISLEALACKMHYPCINRLSGCTAKLSLEERDKHELNCSFKGFKCAMDKCPWVGKLEDVVEHWSSKKTKSKIYHGSNICHTKIKHESYYTNLVEIDKQLFWFKCKVERGKIFWAVQFLGPKDEAKDFYYEIEVFKPGCAMPKILLSDYCQAADIENNELFRDGICISASTDCVNRFMSDDQLLIYYLRVNEDESNEGSEGAAEGKKEARKSRKHFRKHGSDKHRDNSKGAATNDAEKHKPRHKKSHDKVKAK